MRVWTRHTLTNDAWNVAIESSHHDSNSYASLLRQCISREALDRGKLVHDHIIKTGYQHDTFLCNLLIQMYGSCGSLEDADKVFRKMHSPNKFTLNIMITALTHNGQIDNARALFDKAGTKDLVAWNSMIAAYAQSGSVKNARNLFGEMSLRDVISWNTMVAAYARNWQGKDAIELFKQMDIEGFQADNFTFISILDACASTSVLDLGKIIHAEVNYRNLNSDVGIGTALVNMYGKCSNVGEAKNVFDQLEKRDVVAWNAMIAAYVQNGQTQQAIYLFEQMHQKNAVSCNTVISAYAQNGNLNFARDLFEKLPKTCVISWNAMIAAYAQNGCFQDAFCLFSCMQNEGVKPERITFITTLNACSNLSQGKLVDACISECGHEADIALATALVDMYGKCGSLSDAKSVFDRLPQKDKAVQIVMISAYAQNGHLSDARDMFNHLDQRCLVSWNAMITAYAQLGDGENALEIFKQMDLEGVQPNKITFTSIIEGCNGLATVAEGRIIHADIALSEFRDDVMIRTALISMYGKCGCLDDVRNIFEPMSHRDVTLWTAVIAAYAQNGNTNEAFAVLEQMDVEGFKPNEITFVSILAACSHAGRAEDGGKYFTALSGYFNVTTKLDHYVCMIDILGRAGKLDEAEELINNMPFHADIMAWKTLLGACEVHNDLKRGARIVKYVLQLDLKNAPSYVLLSNMFSK